MDKVAVKHFENQRILLDFANSITKGNIICITFVIPNQWAIFYYKKS